MNDNHIIISDELLSAFLDGNTSAEDTMRVLKAAEQDENLQEIIRVASEVDEDMASLKPAITKPVPHDSHGSQAEGKLSLRYRV